MLSAPQAPQAEEYVESPVDIEVIVPTYQRPVELARCLEGLAEQSLQPSLVSAVVREGDQESVELVRRGFGSLPLRVLTVYGTGVVAALNAAAEFARAPLLALIDDDAIPPSRWLEDLARRMRESGAGIVCGRDILPLCAPSSANTRIGTISWYGRTTGNHHVGAGPAREVALFKGVNVLFRREFFLPPPPGLLRGSGAEVAWEIVTARRATLRGAKLVYDPSITVHHFPAARPGESARDCLSPTTVLDHAYNTFLAVSCYRPTWQVLVILTYRLAVGARPEPGVVRAIAGVARRERTVAERLRPALMGTTMGALSWWRLRRSLMP